MQKSNVILRFIKIKKYFDDDNIIEEKNCKTEHDFDRQQSNRA